VLNFLNVQKIDIQALMVKMSVVEVKERVAKIIQEDAKQTETKPKPVKHQHGLATIPLIGIDVPFHSIFLRSRVKRSR